MFSCLQINNIYFRCFPFNHSDEFFDQVKKHKKIYSTGCPKKKLALGNTLFMTSGDVF